MLIGLKDIHELKQEVMSCVCVCVKIGYSLLNMLQEWLVCDMCLQECSDKKNFWWIGAHLWVNMLT